MSLTLYDFVCDPLGHAFTSPEASGTYGEFVMRGEQSSVPALLHALEDRVYSEVDLLLETMGAYTRKTSRERAQLLQRVFGVACDPAPDGTMLVLGRQAPCPTCGSRTMRSWQPAAPPRLYTGDIAPVTHEAWNTLSQREKEAKLRAAIASLTSPH